MVAVYTSPKRAGGFILAEAAGNRSRENGTVLMGQVLVAGTVIQLDGAGKIIVADGIMSSADVAVTDAAGIIYDNVDATLADVPAAYFARECTVNGNEVIFPAASSAAQERVAYIASLKKLQIIVRD